MWKAAAGLRFSGMRFSNSNSRAGSNSARTSAPGADVGAFPKARLLPENPGLSLALFLCRSEIRGGQLERKVNCQFPEKVATPLYLKRTLSLSGEC